jgi:putative lipoic acid-binding regulatory protein
MGKNSGKLECVVVEIVSRHAPDTHNHEVNTKPSKDGNYLAVTVTIEASSKQQLDAIYQDLVDHPHVLMAL